MDSAAIETCPNCSTSLLGSHCHECGQKKLDASEYSLKQFIGRSINDFTDLESNKVFRTLSALIVHPGLLAVEYLAGRRGKYLGPLKLYLTFSALYFLFAWTVLSEVRGGSAQRIAQHPVTVSMAKQRGLDPNTFAEKIQETRSESEDVGVDQAAGDAELKAGGVGDGVVGSIPLEFF